jgi:phosphoribosylformylglycinamidine synthase
MARDHLTPFEALFSESQARAVVAVTEGDAERRLACLAATQGVPAVRLGTTGAPGPKAEGLEDEALAIVGMFTLPLAEARTAFHAPLPTHFAD